MWIDTPIFKQDMDQIIYSNFIPWEILNRKTIFVTGATGLIGYYLISSLMYRNWKIKDKIRILALVRDEDAAMEMFQEQRNAVPDQLFFIRGDLKNFPKISDHIDYIIHAGGPTDSLFFAQHPVETIDITLEGMNQILRLAKANQVESLVYLSTMEVYGTYLRELKIKENFPSYINTIVSRNSYPESKRLCENLCAAFFSEYQVPAKVIRLTQTFGPGIRKTDQRVFAQFIRAYLNKENICLVTEGKTKRSYLYLSDAVTAILTVLLKGKPGEAYNAANETTYCSIRQMADMIACEISHGGISVEVHLTNKNKVIQYLPTAYINLDTQKLQGLGWTWRVDLKNSFLRTIQCMK